MGGVSMVQCGVDVALGDACMAVSRAVGWGTLAHDLS